jgi:hypothetical protein
MSLGCPSFLRSLDPDLCRAIDHYCERASESWQAEPLNALSNLALVIAGWAALRLAARRSRIGRDLPLHAAIALIPVIGVCSLAFHTLATRWAEWLDVVPILAFMLLYLWLAMGRFLGWPVPVKLPILFAFLAATLGLEAGLPATVLWGGAMYLPSLTAITVMGLAPARWVSDGARASFLLALPVFLLAFAWRTLDVPLCARLPFGTHFLWHVFIALFLYLLARAAILQGRARLGPGGVA